MGTLLTVRLPADGPLNVRGHVAPSGEVWWCANSADLEPLAALQPP